MDASEESSLSLHEQLAQAVEHKSADNVLQSPWKFNDEDDAPIPGMDSDGSNDHPEGEKPKTSAPPSQSSPKISDEIKKASAETSTMLFDSILKITGGIVVNNKFKKRFSSDEMRTILEKDLEDKDIEDVDSQDLVLKKKFDRLLKQRDKKNKAIPLDDDEYKNVMDAFYQYYKVKDMSMPPEALLYFTLGSVLASRTLEITLD